MKALLMYGDRDFNPDRELPRNEQPLTQDLELEVVFRAMAGGDAFLLQVARTAILSGLDDPDAIEYRQAVLSDCLEHSSAIREIYDLAVGAIEGERKIHVGLFRDSPEATLGRAVRVLHFFVEQLKRLREIAAREAPGFRSDGFARLFAEIESELDDGYFLELEDHLRRLKFARGVHMSVRLGRGNIGTDYVLRESPRQRWRDRLPVGDRTSYTFRIADHDENGARALSRLRDRGLDLVANALAQSTDHILSFFIMLRSELGFYIGSLNLHRRLGELGAPTCLPAPTGPHADALTCRGLYDVGLTLTVGRSVVGNDLDADLTSLIIITGANQGGKSTFLRSLGVAQLMMQAGMFVAADDFRASVCAGVFTHFKREEDAGMKSGKLDEELGRMSEIIDQLTPNCLLLCNESFAATNEREGSAIARQIIRALVERRIRVLFVTHLFDLAHGFYDQVIAGALFLRAERRSDGQRTFKLVEGEPLPTSYGGDLYRRILGADYDAASADARP